MELLLAKSKAGHDKNHIYVVVGEEKDVFFLANGTTKKCQSPKKKKKIHVQPIKHLASGLTELASGKELDDDLVAEILNLYNRRD